MTLKVLRHHLMVGMLALTSSYFSPAINAHETVSSFEGSIYYSKLEPGRWSGQEDTHIPEVTIEKGEKGLKVTVVTPHPMKGFEHYIVKHVLIDKDFNVLGEKMFNPTKEFEPKSEFAFEGAPYSGVLFVVSICNKHDAWVTTINTGGDEAQTVGNSNR